MVDNAGHSTFLRLLAAAFLLVPLASLTSTSTVFASEKTQPATVGAASEPGGKPAEQGQNILTGTDANAVGRVLLVFLVLSVVFEVALNPIFDWRIYLVYLEEKGWKTPITVGLAFLVFWGYGLDIISDLLVALGKPAQMSLGGQGLTALLIAGGSAGVLKIFRRLGIQMKEDEREAKTEKARTIAGERASAKRKPVTSHVANAGDRNG